MNKTTIRIQDKTEMVGFIRSIGTECRFVSLLTETAVKMRKTNNPFVGTVKVSHRNGLVNINYVEAVKRGLAELNGGKANEQEYVAGSTWYKHETTTDGKPLPLCVHQKDSSKFYLQYFPNRTIGKNTYFLNGKQLTEDEVKSMKTFIAEDKRTEFKPIVITLAIDSIREIRFRKIQMQNHTTSRLVNRLAAFKNQAIPLVETKVESTLVPA